MRKLTGTALALSVLLLTGCSGAGWTYQPDPIPTPTEFGGLIKDQLLLMTDMGAAEDFCIERLGKGTPAEADCYDYAKQVCFDKDDTVVPHEPLRGDCTRRLESYGWTTGSS